MTKERRLAIQMWKGICDMLSASDSFTGFDIHVYKREFCEEHGLNWLNNCWFCEYIPSCSKCPLKSCSDGLYWIVLVDHNKKNVRIDACNNIIKALGGKV